MDAAEYAARLGEQTRRIRAPLSQAYGPGTGGKGSDAASRRQTMDQRQRQITRWANRQIALLALAWIVLFSLIVGGVTC